MLVHVASSHVADTNSLFLPSDLCAKPVEIVDDSRTLIFAFDPISSLVDCLQTAESAGSK